jgi:hypothetical protein
MKSENVKTALTATLKSLVDSKDIEAEPRNVPILVGELSSLIQAREAEALQLARDIAAANSIPSVQAPPESLEK